MRVLRLFSDRVQSGVGFSLLLLPEVSNGGLQRIPNFVAGHAGAADGLVVFTASGCLLSHERIGIGDPDLRRLKCRIDFQGLSIMLECTARIARHAQDFGIRVLRIGLAGQ